MVLSIMEIIKLEKDVPVIYSYDMAMGFEIQHRSIYRMCSVYKKDLEAFGEVRFKITSSDSGQNVKVAILNEQQATFLATLLRNNGKAVEFKKQLVKEFFKMKGFIDSKKIVRAIGLETRKTLTDSIKESGENERMHGKGYSNYTRLVYQVTGLKEDYKEYKKHFPKGDYRTSLNPTQLKQIELAESLIKPMLELEKEYSEIKKTLEPLFKTKEIGE